MVTKRNSAIITCFLILIFSITDSVRSQSYPGYMSDNYAGVQGTLFNPASIVDSRFRTDINLFSTSSSLNNDFYGINLFKLANGTYNSNTDNRKFFTPNNSGTSYSDVMGPAIMFNIAPKHAIAIFTRARAVANLTNFNGLLLGDFEGGIDNANSFNVIVGSPNAVIHTWGEIGASYGTVLIQKKQHFLKGGITAKYLVGGYNAYANGQNVSAKYVENSTDPAQSTMQTTGTLTLGSSQQIFSGATRYNFDTNSTGFGLDFGFIYEWRPDYAAYDLAKAKPADNNFKDKNKYKLRFGFSITDLGSITYKNANQEVYDLNRTFTRNDVDNVDNIKQLFQSKGWQIIHATKNVNVKLPTVMHLDADWYIRKRFYLNAMGNLSLTSKTGYNSNSVANTFFLTPRYEVKWFSAYLPFNYMEYSGFQVGTGFRMGPVFFGSSSVITNLISTQSKAADVYFGLKIPIYQKHFVDTDNDGIFDDDDACPTVPGPIENKGCPWPDADKDGVADKDDACPDFAGPAENKGCPWPDTDKDGVLDKDDECPQIAGPVENKGCPWKDTDGDGILDKDDACPDVAGLAEFKGCPLPDADKDGVPDKIDECPTVAGPASNHGCPVVTKAVIETLKVQARSVYFNTGKATFKAGDAGTITSLDAIKEILKNYPNAKFSIEGHTDNVGSPKVNKKLSLDRANAVRNALIEKGINPQNLVAKGFGSSKPIASNKTAKGRAQNRRTEIRHIGSVYEGKL